MRSHIAPLTVEPPADETGPEGAAGADETARALVPTARTSATGLVVTRELRILLVTSLPSTQACRWLTTLLPCLPALSVLVVPVDMLASLRRWVPKATASVVEKILCLT